MMHVWQWDIYYTTHDLLRAGITEAARSRVEVLAPDYHTSWIYATEMVIYRSGFYITRTELVW